MKQFLLLFIFLTALTAQERGPLERRPMERLENLKKVRMLEALKLDEEKGLKLVHRYNKHREGVRELEEDRRAIVDKLEQKLIAGASDSEFQKSFGELTEVEKKISEARTKYFNELKEILTTKEIAQYIIFERNFANDIRDIMREERKERRQK